VRRRRLELGWAELKEEHETRGIGAGGLGSRLQGVAHLRFGLLTATPWRRADAMLPHRGKRVCAVVTSGPGQQTHNAE